MNLVEKSHDRNDVKMLNFLTMIVNQRPRRSHSRKWWIWFLRKTKTIFFQICYREDKSLILNEMEVLSWYIMSEPKIYFWSDLNNESDKGNATSFKLIKMASAQSKNPWTLEFQRVTHLLYEVIISWIFCLNWFCDFIFRKIKD